MKGTGDRINVALLAMPEVTASALFGMFDLFSAPGRDWPFILSGEPGSQRMNPFIVAREKTEFMAANGIVIRPDHALDDCPTPHIVCIPDFFVNPGEILSGRYDPEAAWLRQMHGGGSFLCSACSGAVLLGEAGFLDGAEATIHWGYVRTLLNNYANVRVNLDRSLVMSGEAQRIVMAGGGTSWQDLALWLIARFVGPEEAMRVARIYMLQWHDLGQTPFASLLGRAQADDATIRDCQDWLADNYGTASPVAAMVARSGLAERTFVRRFTRATGLAPLDYVHALRLEEAKQMLETGAQPVDAIAEEVGYEDSSFFRRLFRRKVGLTPAQYRRRFAGFRQAVGSPV
ncbi:GlxA family transcriptional regulator [Paragemmobacter straminiformis]|uniref:Helix-turn-helix domain-containing protein n=1 Tax=Paragemmobacter straminiformis TaxID=2045119 RepID=A0A842I681_9RHOB|nr:helix-turn-helix domain-containing protein [Gemmobacter straminiformis]MBC2835091.1 helix-turn-helix domain-containing protein [Gemmobacter straminiformis]